MINPELSTALEFRATHLTRLSFLATLVPLRSWVLLPEMAEDCFLWETERVMSPRTSFTSRALCRTQLGVRSFFPRTLGRAVSVAWFRTWTLEPDFLG